MTDDLQTILQTLRAQSWARAKGELQATLQTYWSSLGKDNKFRNFDNLVEEFIKEVESNGLIE